MAKLLTFIIFALYFPFYFSFSADLLQAFFPTYTLKERNFEKAVDDIKNSLEAQGIKVYRILKISEALKNRGVEFTDYYVIFACQMENMDKILTKAPALSNLIPCSLPVYKDKDGSIKVSTINGTPFLAKYGKFLTPEQRMDIVSTYRKLRYSLNNLSVRHVKLQRIPAPMEELVSEEVVKNITYDEFRMLFESSLNGANMNVLDTIKVSSEPKFDIFLACNLSYGESIFKSLPQFGALAPCRIYTYETKEDIRVGYINMKLFARMYKPYLSKDGIKIFEQAEEDVKKAVKEAGGN